MTGLNGKRKAVETPLAKRPAQHKPQASRRTKRTKEPALPRKRESSTARAPLADGRDEYASVSYSLRNRIVYVPIPKNTSKHIVPSTSEPAPPESDFRKEPKYRQSNQTSTCAQMGLEHYNSMNQGDEHELVKAVDSNSVIFNGVWIHANFLAKRKGVPRKFGGCGVCPPQIMHPVDGGYLSAQPFNPSAPPGNCVMGL
ncbi:hypothetical protein SORBI_3002G427700 [Sorghum bicolor]|uniref:DUF3615 domain-containing protein n=1 Tax=Sorghum bicolor TaxID=4558 RepID=A0A1W0W828_SORBI|nr:hypothetical protein SORBI_3002G427700 [Sorghum bicolor]